MKKLLYFLLFAIITSLAISSCTEEEIKPQTESSGVGGEKIKE
jgi:hypothetical protein